MRTRDSRQRAPTAPHYHSKFARTATQRSRRMVDKHTGSLQGPDPPPPLPNPTTLHRSGPPADFVHMTGRPHHGTCGVQLEGIRNTVTVHKTVALMRSMTRSCVAALAASAASAAYAPQRSPPPPAQPVHHLGGRLRFGQQYPRASRARSVDEPLAASAPLILHDQLHVPSPRKVLKLNLF